MMIIAITMFFQLWIAVSSAIFFIFQRVSSSSEEFDSFTLSNCLHVPICLHIMLLPTKFSNKVTFHKIIVIKILNFIFHKYICHNLHTQLKINSFSSQSPCSVNTIKRNSYLFLYKMQINGKIDTTFNCSEDSDSEQQKLVCINCSLVLCFHFLPLTYFIAEIM